MEKVALSNSNTPEEFDSIWKNQFNNTVSVGRSLYVYEEHILKYFKDGLSVLEIGCGDGYFLKYLTENFKDLEVYGIDTSKIAIDYAKEKFNISCDVKDFNTLNCNKKYDIVMSHQVIEHLENPETFAAKCSKFLKPDGILIISSITNTYNYDRMHLWSFSGEDFNKYFTDFYSVEVETLDVAGHPKGVIVGIGKGIKRFKVMLCCARWLGINCLIEVLNNSNIEVIGISTTSKDKKVWWTDVKEEVSVEAFGYKDKLVDFKDISKFIEQNKPDIVFSVLTDYIFKQKDIDNTNYGIINLHPAPLPFYRGCNSYAHAIMNGEKQYGVSLHYVNSNIDTGDIIEVSWLDILSDDTGKTLYDKSQLVALDLFKKQLPKIIESALQGKKVESFPQDNSKARYYDRNSLKEIKELPYGKPQIDFNNFYNKVRALEFDPFEPAYFIDNNVYADKSKKIYLRIK